MIKVTKMRKLLASMGLMIAVVFFTVIVSDTQARQFRQMVPITTPELAGSNLPEGALPVKQVKPLDRGAVESMLGEVLNKWNKPGMSETLAQEFYDSSRLMDAMNTIVPRDATLKLQSIQGIQTLQQYLVPGTDGGQNDMISIVSVTARTQVEFEKPGAGFVRLPGVNEYILKITTTAP